MPPPLFSIWQGIGAEWFGAGPGPNGFAGQLHMVLSPGEFKPFI